MVAKQLSIWAVLLLAASCTGVFDSYFPQSVEYLENRADLKGKLGRDIVSVRMQLMQGGFAHPDDVLVVIANTDDGEQTVLFYNGQLKLLKSYSGSQLAAANGDVPPDLYPIVQDYLGIHTGQIEYQFVGRAPVPKAPPSGTLPDFLTPGFNGTAGGFSRFRSTYYEDTVANVAYPTLFSDAGQNVEMTTPPDFSSVRSLYELNPPGQVPLPGPSSNSRLLDVTCWDLTYRFVIGSGSSVGLITLNSSDPAQLQFASLVTGKPKGDGIDLSEAWATATAAVVRNHSDNASELVAFAWTGKELGRLRTTSSNEAAFAFHPSGEFWYSYDPATGMLSEYKAWW